LLLSFWLVAVVALRLGLVERLVPRERLEPAASSARGMWFEASWPVDYIDPGITQERDAALECWVRGERTVDERQHDYRYAKAYRFSKDSKRKVVADAVGPLIDRVVGDRCDDDRIDLGE
jgi:hypothetical protein